MPTNYPAALDAFTNPDAAAGDTLDDPPHGDQHADANDAIEAIETELGINPRGSEATVRARLDAIESAASDLPQGPLAAPAEVTSSQTGITSETDLTGLSVTVDVPADRRVRIIGFVRTLIDTANALTDVRIKEGGTILQSSRMSHPTSSTDGTMTHRPEVILTPSSGSHTYNLAGVAPTSGTAQTVHSSAVPAFILVEDIGPA